MSRGRCRGVRGLCVCHRAAQQDPFLGQVEPVREGGPQGGPQSPGMSSWEKEGALYRDGETEEGVDRGKVG